MVTAKMTSNALFGPSTSFFESFPDTLNEENFTWLQNKMPNYKLEEKTSIELISKNLSSKDYQITESEYCENNMMLQTAPFDFFSNITQQDQYCNDTNNAQIENQHKILRAEQSDKLVEKEYFNNIPNDDNCKVPHIEEQVGKANYILTSSPKRAFLTTATNINKNNLVLKEQDTNEKYSKILVESSKVGNTFEEGNPLLFSALKKKHNLQKGSSSNENSGTANYVESHSSLLNHEVDKQNISHFHELTYVDESKMFSQRSGMNSMVNVAEFVQSNSHPYLTPANSNEDSTANHDSEYENKFITAICQNSPKTEGDCIKDSDYEALRSLAILPSMEFQTNRKMNLEVLSKATIHNDEHRSTLQETDISFKRKGRSINVANISRKENLEKNSMGAFPDNFGKDSIKQDILAFEVETKQNTNQKSFTQRKSAGSVSKKSLRTSSTTKVYACEKCHSKFRKFEHLKRHTSSLHMGQKPYECDICETQFSRADNFQQHLKTMRHHSKSIEKGKRTGVVRAPRSQSNV